MLESKPVIKSYKHDFKKSFSLSLAIHGLILSLFLIKFTFFTEPYIDISQAINVSVGDFKDSNRLPEKIQTLPPADNKKMPPKLEEPVEEKTEVPKKELAKPAAKEIAKPDMISLAKAKQKAALNKLKKASALEKIKQDLKNDSITKLRTQEKKSFADSKTRIIAAGTTLGGLDKLQANNYLQEIDHSIKQFWSLPQWLINKPLKAQALVKFNMQGQILSVKIISSSGNNSYDQYCLQAIENAAPFPKVPEKLTEKFSADGVVIGFPE